MAFGDAGVLDNFNRADGALGANWTASYFGGGALTILSQQLRGSSGNYFEDYWNATTWDTVEVWITIATLPANTDVVWLDVRIANPGAATLDSYEVVWNYSSGGTDTVTISRNDNGVTTQLGATINQEFAAGDGLGVSMTGSTIEVWRRSSGVWSSLGTRTDATYSAAGYIGVGEFGSTGRYDDFGGGAYTAGGVAATPRLMLLGVG